MGILLWIWFLFPFIFIGLVVACIVALVQVSGLKKRVRILEQAVQDGQTMLARPQETDAHRSQGWSEQQSSNDMGRSPDQVPGATQMPVPQVDAHQPETPEMHGSIPLHASTPAVRVQTGPTESEKFLQWIKDDWMLKLGALLVLIGFGWFVTYAFMNNWIGATGRITLGILAGLFFIILGYWRIKKYVHQGSVFLVLGSTTILLSVFAGREMYGMFTPATALAIMFLSTAFVAFVSVAYKNRALAFASLVLAGVAPLLTASADPSYAGLFAYLFVVALGTIWVVALTGRRELTFVALIIIFLYSYPHLFSFTTADPALLLLFAYGFSAVFFLTNTLGVLKLKGKAVLPDLYTAVGTGLFLLAWILTSAPPEWQSLIIVAWMVVFLVGSFIVFQATGRKESFYVYAGVGVAMLATATATELEGAGLTIAYTIESGALALVGYMLLRDVRIAERLCLLLIGPVFLSFGNIASYSGAQNVLTADFFVILLLGAVLFGQGLFLWYVREVEGKKPGMTSATLLVVGSVYGYMLLWLTLLVGLSSESVAVMISLVVYTLIGLVTYFAGLSKGMKGLQLYGGALVGFVVARLLLFDLWNMDLTGRIITFFLIGALLIATAFITKRKKDTSETDNHSSNI